MIYILVPVAAIVLYLIGAMIWPSRFGFRWCERHGWIKCSRSNRKSHFPHCPICAYYDSPRPVYPDKTGRVA